MLFLLIAASFDPIVNGITTTKIEATIGAKLWKDRGYSISGINDELLGAILFQPKHYVNSKTISIESNNDADIFIALYEEGNREGGLMEALQADQWTLENGWYLEWSNKHKLNKVWSRKINSGESVSFRSTKNRMTFAILIKEGNTLFNQNADLKLYKVKLQINFLIKLNFFLAAKGWNVLLAQTTIGGPLVNSETPIPARFAFYLANEDTWIVGIKEQGDLKMVKLKVTGTNTFDWISSKQKQAGSCGTSFSEACFDGNDVDEDKYQVHLVAEAGMLDQRKIIIVNMVAKTYMNFTSTHKLLKIIPIRINVLYAA